VRSSLEEMRQPGKLMKPDHWMGLSTFVIKHGQTTLLGHTGGQAYFSGFVYFNPATSAAVIYAFNTDMSTTGPYDELRLHVYDFLAK
jgi:hypothetical protein